MISRRSLTRLSCTASLLALPSVARSQGRYPDRPIRLVIPFVPGGATDITGRHLAHRLGVILGAQVVVDNRGAAGGVPATIEVARSRPDGYTLMIGTSSTHGINPSLMENIGYDPVRDFTPIMVVSTQPMLLACTNAFPAQTLPEVIAAVRAAPGRYSYGSAGVGSINHLTGELFNRLAGVQIVHVPYRGTGQSVNDLVSGVIELLHATSSTTLPLWRDGRLRIPAVFAERRMRAAPEIPTAIEQGMPQEMVSATFNALLAPAGTPNEIVDMLFRATQRVVADEALQHAMDDLAIELVRDSDPQKAADYIRSDIARWLPVIRETGIRRE